MNKDNPTLLTAEGCCHSELWINEFEQAVSSVIESIGVSVSGSSWLLKV